MEKETLFDDAEAHLRVIINHLRSSVVAFGRTGPIPHALNIAATHAQDALGQVLVAKAGGSPGIG